MTDEFYIKRCIELAQKAIGYTYPNPMVGSVIVHQGNIIGEGYHHKAGQPHAEINAINSVENKELLKESTIYVSLEPCAHFGKTPPCALKLKEIGFQRVVIGTLDSHDKVNGKGVKILEEAGIKVDAPLLEKEAIELNKRFFTYHQKKRPFIILKWAQSNDGFIDKDFKPYSIGNPLTKQIVHQLRADEHAILVGKNTALNDNPSLTIRAIVGRNPIRVLVDLNLEIPTSFNLYNQEAETIFFNTLKSETIENITFIKVDKENLIEQILEKLFEKQIQSLIVEGGANTLQQFIDANFWDEAVIIKNQELDLNNGTIAPKFNHQIQHTKTLRNNIVEYYSQYQL